MNELNKIVKRMKDRWLEGICLLISIGSMIKVYLLETIYSDITIIENGISQTIQVSYFAEPNTAIILFCIIGLSLLVMLFLQNNRSK